MPTTRTNNRNNATAQTCNAWTASGTRCTGTYRPGGLCSAGHHSDADRARPRPDNAAGSSDVRRAGAAAAAAANPDGTDSRFLPRNVRAARGSSAATSYARTVSGITDNQNNSEYYALLREGEGQPHPTAAEVQEWLDGLAARVRSDNTLTDSMRRNTLARIDEARASDLLPDGAMFHAWRNIEGRARQRRAAIDEVYGQFSQVLGMPVNEVERLAKRHMKVARDRGRNTAAPDDWVRTFQETGPDNVPTDRITLYAFHQLAVEGRRRRGEDVPEPAPPRRIERTPVESSFITSVGYDPDRRVLEVEMRGNVYQYQGVPDYVHEAVVNSDSVGTAYNRYVKNQYPAMSGPANMQCRDCGQFLSSDGQHSTGACPSPGTTETPVARIVAAADPDAEPEQPVAVPQLSGMAPAEQALAVARTDSADDMRWVAEHGSTEARISLSQRRDLPEDVAATLSASGDVEVTGNLRRPQQGRCPDCGEYLSSYEGHECDGLASTHMRYLRSAGTGIDPERWRTDRDYRLDTARSWGDDANARMVVSGLPYNDRRILANDPSTPPAIVEALVTSIDDSLHGSLVRHPNVTPRALGRLAASRASLHEAASAHPNFQEAELARAVLARATNRRYSATGFQLNMPNASQLRSMTRGRDAFDSVTVPVEAYSRQEIDGTMMSGRLSGDVTLTRRGRTMVGSGENLRCDCGRFSDGSPCDHVNRAVQAVELLTNSRQVRTALAGLGSADAAAAAELSADRRAALRQQRRAREQRRGTSENRPYDPSAPVVWADAEMAALMDRMRDSGHADASWAADDDDTFQETFQAAYELGKAKKQRGESPVPFMKENATAGLGARDGGRSFGVELEFDIAPGVDQATALRNIGRELHEAGLTRSARQEGYHGSARRGWTEWGFESDCTVAGEIVTPIMYDEPECWEELEQVCEILRRNGAVASRRAGAHVNVGVADYDHTVENYENLLGEYHRNEDVMFRLAQNPAADQHRGDQWCHPNRAPGSGRTALPSHRGTQTRMTGSTDALNFESADGSEKGRVEFRLWDSTLEPGTIQAQVKASLGMVHAAFGDGRPPSPDERRGRGYHRDRNQRGSALEGDAWKEQTSEYRKFVDRIFSRPEDKAQLTTLFATTKWGRRTA